jgi:hypothetical protein
MITPLLQQNIAKNLTNCASGVLTGEGCKQLLTPTLQQNITNNLANCTTGLISGSGCKDIKIPNIINNTVKDLYLLYTNKNDGEALLPELQHLDYIWLLKGVFFNNDELFKELQQNLRTIQGVQLVTEVAHEKIKSRDNLQL